MNNDSLHEISSPPAQNRRRFLPFLVGLGGTMTILAAWGVFIWWFTPAPTIEHPQAWERQADGPLEPVGEINNPKNKSPFSAHLGKLQSQNSLTTASSSMYSYPASFYSRSLFLINDSDHLLMKRVGQELLDSLKSDIYFTRLEYFPADHRPELGTSAPDLILSLQLVSLEESGLLNKNLHAEIKATLGTALDASHHKVNDYLSAPILNLNTRISLHHESTWTGVESSAAHYDRQSQEIAQQIAKTVLEAIKKQRSEHPNPWQFPRSFFPSWIAPPAFGFLETFDAELMTSFHGLMSHNETFWKLNSVPDATNMLATIHEELKSSSWEGAGSADDGPPAAPMRRTKDDRALVLEVFEVDAQPRHPTVTANTAPTNTWLVRFQHRMSREELTEAVEGVLMADTPPMDFLLALHSFANTDQRERIMAKMEAGPVESLTGWLALAKMYVDRRDVPGATRALRRAHHLTYTLTNDANDKQEIKKLAKKLDLDQEAIMATDPTIFEELGFVSLPRKGDALQVGVPPGKIAKFLGADGDGKPMPLIVKVNAAGYSPDSHKYDLMILQFNSSNSRSWGESNGQDLSQPYKKWITFHDHRYQLIFEKLENHQVRVSVAANAP